MSDDDRDDSRKVGLWVVFTSVAVLLLGVLVKTVNMSIGMLVHEGSVLLVIINAMRLLGYKEKGQK